MEKISRRRIARRVLRRDAIWQRNGVSYLDLNITEIAAVLKKQVGIVPINEHNINHHNLSVKSRNMKKDFYFRIAIFAVPLISTLSGLSALGVGTGPKRHCSILGRYCVTIPEVVDLGGGQPLNRSLIDGFGSSYSSFWRGPELYLQAGFADFTEGGNVVSASERASKLAEVIANGKHLISTELDTDAITVRETEVNKVPVTDISVALENAEFIYRLATTEKGIVVLNVVFTPESKPSAIIFLNSLETPDIALIVKEKLEAATPGELPICGESSNSRTDLEINNLRGSVHELRVEREKIENGESLRDLQLFQEYDPRGRLKKEINYSGTWAPDNVRVFGCIDGKRVSKLGSVAYENRFSVFGAPRPGAKPRDDRYTSLYEVRSDDNGRIQERVIFGNDSLVHTTQKFTYGKDSLEIVSIDSDGGERSRESYTFDSKGRVVKVVEKRLGEKIEWRETFLSGEFDSKGNWSERSGVYEIYKDEKLDARSTFTEYRTITYFK